jgi:hypothetical protein
MAVYAYSGGEIGGVETKGGIDAEFKSECGEAFVMNEFNEFKVPK